MTLSELSVRRPVFALMLISFLVVLPGATAEEMSTQVVLPLEEAVNTISGLDELNSKPEVALKTASGGVNESENAG